MWITVLGVEYQSEGAGCTCILMHMLCNKELLANAPAFIAVHHLDRTCPVWVNAWTRHDIATMSNFELLIVL